MEKKQVIEKMKKLTSDYVELSKNYVNATNEISDFYEKHEDVISDAQENDKELKQLVKQLIDLKTVP